MKQLVFVTVLALAALFLSSSRPQFYKSCVRFQIGSWDVSLFRCLSGGVKFRSDGVVLPFACIYRK